MSDVTKDKDVDACWEAFWKPLIYRVREAYLAGFDKGYDCCDAAISADIEQNIFEPEDSLDVIAAKLSEKGWRIRPVKLVFLDEVEDDNETIKKYLRTNAGEEK